MAWDAFIETSKIIGIPLTMAIVAIWAFATGLVVTRKSYDDMVQEKNAQILRERDQANLYWGIVEPALRVGREALRKVERERGREGPERARS